MEFTINKGSKAIKVDVKEMRGLMRGIGLMLRTRKTRSLLFAFRKPSRVAITSFFVFFPFLAVWTDSRKRAIEARIVRPFTFSVIPRKDAAYLVEIPLNRKNDRIIDAILGS